MWDLRCKAMMGYWTHRVSWANRVRGVAPRSIHNTKLALELMLKALFCLFWIQFFIISCLTLPFPRIPIWSYSQISNSWFVVFDQRKTCPLKLGWCRKRSKQVDKLATASSHLVWPFCPRITLVSMTLDCWHVYGKHWNYWVLTDQNLSRKLWNITAL